MQRLPSAFALILVSLAALSAPSSTAAAPILIDQQHLGTRVGGIGTFQGTDLAQTFTVGITGVLTQLDLMVFYPHADYLTFTDPLSIELRSTADGKPTQTILQSITVAPQDLPMDRLVLTAFTGFALDVTSGDLLAIVLSTGALGNYGWGMSGCCYDGGGAFFTDASYGAGFIPISGGPPFHRTDEFMFRTWVEPQEVPEPGTLLLLATGIASFAVGRRKLRRLRP